MDIYLLGIYTRLLKTLLHGRELFKRELEGSSVPLKSQYWWLSIHSKPNTKHESNQI